MPLQPTSTHTHRHRPFRTHRAHRATHLTQQSQFHNHNHNHNHHRLLPAAAATGQTTPLRMRKQRTLPRRRQSEKKVVEGVGESTWDSDCGDRETFEDFRPSQLQISTPPSPSQPPQQQHHKTWLRAPNPFRRTPRRILPPRRQLRSLPRPVSAKRVVSAVVLGAWRYLMVLLLVLLVVVGFMGFVMVMVVGGYCERYGCDGFGYRYGYGCYKVLRI